MMATTGARAIAARSLPAAAARGQRGHSSQRPDRSCSAGVGTLAHAPTTPDFAGYIAQSCWRWPGYLSTSADVKFADLPNGILALKGVPPLGLAQILLFIGLMETQTWRFLDGSWPGTVPAGKAPGDVAGDFWVRYTDPEEKAYKLNIELNNGRAAMMGITGMLMHDHITGSWVPPGF